MKVAILGFGKQGQAALEYWGGLGHEITVCDQNEALEAPEGVQTHLGASHLENLDQFDLIVRSPIVHPRDIVAKNSETILDKVTTVTNEFFKVCPTKNIIGVTGTKGKGTTSTLIAKMLEAAGKHVHLGGNIGTPPLELLRGAGALHGDAMQGAGEARTESYIRYGEGTLEPATPQSTPSSVRVASSAGQQDKAVQSIQPDDWVVLELANFQLIDLKYSPATAVCLMVVPEHQDWHGDMEEYVEAKKQLFRWQKSEDIAIYLAENELSKQIAAVSAGTKIPYFASPGARIENSQIIIGDTVVAPVKDIKLLGRHNWQNICAAVTAVWQITQDEKALKSVIASFSGLEHRLEFVRELDGVKYYDDSFGTAPETAIVAIEAFAEPKVLIAGGSDKGADYSELVQKIIASNVKHVIAIGVTGSKIAEMLETKADKRHVTYSVNSDPNSWTMSHIVDLAKEQAESGDVVLLSTGSASFGLFKNYADRGEQFQQVVNAL